MRYNKDKEKETEKEQICDDCQEEAKECAQCGKKFNVGDKIICGITIFEIETNGVHFCCEDCMNTYIERDITYRYSEVIEEEDENEEEEDEE